MTTITASEYKPSGQALAPLNVGQVGLLNKGASFDISDRVRTVVQRHLGYQGTEVFKTTFTKQQITFTLTTGSADEARTLKYENSQWMLSKKNNAPATPLDPALQNEVDGLIRDILSNIRQAHNSNAPAAAQPNPAPVSIAPPAASVAPIVNASELIEIKERLRNLEEMLRHPNPTLEQSLQVQRRIEELLARLTDTFNRRPLDNGAERHLQAEKEGLLRSVAELRNSLEQAQRLQNENLDKQRKNFEKNLQNRDDLLRDLQRQLDAAQRDLETQKQAVNQAHAAKDEAVAALDRRVVELEASLAEKQAQQGKAREEFEAFKVQAAAALEKAHKQTSDHLQENLQRLRKAEAEREQLQHEFRAEKSALEKQKTALEQVLATSSSDAQSANVQQLQKIDELSREIRAQKIDLETAAQRIQAHEKLIAEQEKQIHDLKAQNNQSDHALAQLKQELAASQKKNEADLTLATSALQQLKAEHDAQLQDRKRTIQALEQEAARLRQALENATKTQQDQTAAQAEKDQAQLQSIQVLKNTAAKQAEQLKTMEADFTEKLTSQVKTIDALKATQQDLETRFAKEKQILVQEKEKALELLTQTEARITAQAEELRALQRRLQEMLETKQRKVAVAQRANQLEGANTAAVEREVAELLNNLTKT